MDSACSSCAPEGDSPPASLVPERLPMVAPSSDARDVAAGRPIVRQEPPARLAVTCVESGLPPRRGSSGTLSWSRWLPRRRLAKRPPWALGPLAAAALRRGVSRDGPTKVVPRYRGAPPLLLPSPARLVPRLALKKTAQEARQ